MSRTMYTAAILVLLSITIIHAGDKSLPKDRVSAVISAPESVVVGELVKLEAQLVYQRHWLRIEGSDAKRQPLFRWELANPPDGYETEDWIFSEGRTCVFATGKPGVYQFILAGTQLGPDGKPRLFLTRHRLVVTPHQPPSPGPEPDPPDPTPPEPDLPDGRFGLAPLVYHLATNQVQVEHRTAARALAENYRAIAARIAAGTLAGTRKILAATTAGNQQAVGSARQAWMPFFEKLAKRMRELDQAEKLTSPEDFQQAWNEIAAGLKAVGANSGYGELRTSVPSVGREG